MMRLKAVAKINLNKWFTLRPADKVITLQGVSNVSIDAAGWADGYVSLLKTLLVRQLEPERAEGTARMKWFLLAWLIPIVLLGGWYGLSYHDIHFGFVMLTRRAHDLVFEIYGNILGMPPQDIPPLVIKAVFVDSLIVLGIVAFRYRKGIGGWIREKRGGYAESPAESEESLSKAP